MDFKAVKPNRGKVIIRILKEDREKGLKHFFKKADGTESFIYTNADLKLVSDESGHQRLEQMQASDDRKSQVFVRGGYVEAVAEDVEGIKVGDYALLDHTLDNEDGCIVGWDGEDKLVCIPSKTTYFKKDVIEYGNWKYPSDCVVAYKGEVEKTTLIIAVIRNGEILAQDPYVILEHKEYGGLKVSTGGILYTEASENTVHIERKVVSVSELSSKKYGIKSGKTVLVKELDTFNIIWNNKQITAVDDRDVIMEIKDKAI